MIPFDFDYYEPKTAEEAVNLHASLRAQGKKPFYFAGGTEIITLGRINQLHADAVIAIKGIAECRTLELRSGRLTMGAAVSLTKLQESALFPLIGDTVGEIADRTSRNKITLGGNLCGRIHYREAALPLLITDTEAVVAGKDGVRKLPLLQLFNKSLLLEEGELLLQFETKADDLKLPYYTMKKRRQWDTGYPLITVAAVRKHRQIHLAVSGVCPFPFRSARMEEALAETGLAPEDRVEQALSHLPGPISKDVEGSPDYRLFVLRNMLIDALEALEGDHGSDG